MKFQVDYDSQPKRFLKKQEIKLAKRIIEKITLLGISPVPKNAKRVINYEGLVFRIRIGEYRALYRINYQTSKIIIVKIDKRDKVY